MRTDMRTDIILTAVVGAVTALIVILGLLSITDSPDVMFSHSTGKCVKVVMPDGSLGSCNRLPKKYNHYWVQ